ncbi:MAG TPA: hypothetical protein VHO47_02640 [Candidatus Babeliales bacterium]|nr:hypothetical protein [Candidatus Babeliales bacterium]
MLKKLLILSVILQNTILALEYEKQLENESVIVSLIKIMPQEEIGLHYDIFPQVVFALQGGKITRLEADGSTTDVEFPTQQAVFRPSEDESKIHRSVNNGSDAIELIIVQLKNQLTKNP